jgi:glutathione synthase/RimK-type ligase-like ATP-grasp enzyme
MKNFVVIYNENDWDVVSPLKDSPATRKSFEDWHEYGLKNDISMFRANIHWFDQKKGVFQKTWAFRNKKWIKSKKAVKPDFIFDKTTGRLDYEMFNLKMSISKKIEVYNHPLFRTLLSNKLSQYLYLGEFMPHSFLATNRKELENCFQKMDNMKTVIKPLYGSGGVGIIIDKKDNIDTAKINYPVLVQEFIKSEKGIPGFSKNKEVSDLRMIFINHKLIYALSRIAKRGSLFTNFHQGASVVSVPKKSIPTSAQRVAKKITSKLSIFPKANYALDFIFTNSRKPILVEMNTVPGLDLLYIVGTKAVKENYFDEMFKDLVK